MSVPQLGQSNMSSSEPFATAYTCEPGVPRGLACILQRVEHKPPAATEFQNISRNESTRVPLGVWRQPYSIPMKRPNDKAGAYILPCELPITTKPAQTSSKAIPKHKPNVTQPIYPIETCLNAISMGSCDSPNEASAKHAGRRVARIEGLPLKHLSRRELHELSHITARLAPEPPLPHYLEYLLGEPQTVRRYSECIGHCTF